MVVGTDSSTLLNTQSKVWEDMQLLTISSIPISKVHLNVWNRPTKIVLWGGNKRYQLWKK